MEKYKPVKTLAIFEIFAYMVLALVFMMVIETLVNSYMEIRILEVAAIIVIIYCLYNLILIYTTKYKINKNGFLIESFWGIVKKEIPFENINGYIVKHGEIKGIKISGFGKHKYCFGQSVINDVGLTYMYVTNNENVIYLHTDEISYGISPEKLDDFIEVIKENNIEEKTFEFKLKERKNIFKDKKLIIPFIIVSIIIIIITLNPFILYLNNKLPGTMPLIFDEAFNPIVIGSSKQFAVKQSIYGVLNMIILFCMYYITQLNSKYSKKISYKYIYISLIIAIIFLYTQIQILQIYL